MFVIGFAIGFAIGFVISHYGFKGFWGFGVLGFYGLCYTEIVGF